MANTPANLDVTMSRKCTAHSARTGEPCQKWAIKGAVVCRTHGGAAKQVKAAAERRLRKMVSPMLDRLHELAMQTNDPKVAAVCVRDALDRAGIGVLVQAKVRSSLSKEQASGGITVNIGFLSADHASPMKLATVERDTLTISAASKPESWPA